MKRKENHLNQTNLHGFMFQPLIFRGVISPYQGCISLGGTLYERRLSGHDMIIDPAVDGFLKSGQPADVFRDFFLYPQDF